MRHLENIGCMAARLRCDVDRENNQGAIEEARAATSDLQEGINNETFNTGKEVIFPALTMGCRVCEMTVSLTQEGAVDSPMGCPSGFCEALLPEAAVHNLTPVKGALLRCTPFEGIPCGAAVDVSGTKAVVQKGSTCHITKVGKNWQQTKTAEINGTQLDDPNVIAPFDGESLEPETDTDTTTTA